MYSSCRQALRPVALLALATLAACAEPGGVKLPEGQVAAPGIDPKGTAVDGAVVGHRLMAAGEYELAISAFGRAAAQRGEIDAELLSGLGAANLGLGRLNQAEDLLRRATEDPDASPEDWNNLGVLLMETGQTEEAIQVFRKAFALSDGENIAIRDNLRLALAKLEESANIDLENNNNYKLVRRGSSEFIIRPVP
ncbi:MAG: tetratricopeptide repeat protein [Pseudomonadota bacterium]